MRIPPMRFLLGIVPNQSSFGKESAHHNKTELLHLRITAEMRLIYRQAIIPSSSQIKEIRYANIKGV